MLSHKIVLASSSDEENLILKKKIDPLVGELGEMKFLSVKPQGLSSILDPNSSLVIINVAQYTKEVRASVLSLRAAAYMGPILVMAKMEANEMIYELQNMQHTVFLEKPFEVKDLQGIIRKYLNARTVQQRVFRRYNTIMSADVELNEEQLKTTSTLFNLSKGGAYIELDQDTPVRKGDQIKVYITLDEIQKSYAMQAKVVWYTPNGMNGGCGLGLEFLGKADIINRL